jgi:hypothetical protein
LYQQTLYNESQYEPEEENKEEVKDVFAGLNTKRGQPIPTEKLKQAIDEPTQEELVHSYNKVSTHLNASVTNN